MLEGLRKAIGEGAVSVATVSGGDGRMRVRPRDLSAAADLVRLAAEHEHQVIAVGAGTKRDWTDPPRGPCIELDMRGCDHVVAYAPEDMTITVEAGMPLGAVAKLLAERGQRVTLDPPHAAEATIGGIIAANDSGPTRLAYGTARDIVIGMSVVAPDGEVVHSGGRVVKNVAGYDLHKLFIGSFGTLGPIATVTFKLRPMPEARGLVLLQPRDAEAAERIVAGVLAGPTRPTMIELLNPAMARTLDLPARLVLIIGFEENAEAVRWQCAQIHEAFGGEPLGEPESNALYARLCEAAGGPAPTSIKATMLSSSVAEFVERAEAVCGGHVRVIARAGSGIAYVLFDAPPGEAALRELADFAEAAEGHIEVRGAKPEGWPRFGRRHGDAALTQGIQRALGKTAGGFEVFAPERLG